MSASPARRSSGRAASRSGWLWPVFALGVALFAAATLAQGYDLDWDILNYHFYNGYAAVHGHVWTNWQVAMRQTYFGPLLDILFYELVIALPATSAALVLASIQSLAFPLLALLAADTLAPVLRSRRGLIAIALFLTGIGVAAPSEILELGSPRGDSLAAIPALAGLLAALRLPRADTPAARGRLATIAGAFGGFAAGLKLTTVPMALGIGAAITIAALLTSDRDFARNVLRPVAAAAAAMVAAFALTYGWWAALLVSHFGNPVFPSFNNFFHSPYATPSSFADPAFALPGWRAKLLFPFVRLSIWGTPDPAGLFDLRMACALPLALAGVATAIRLRVSRPEFALATLPLLGFFLVAYAAWLLVFPINRYAVMLELLAPLICAAAIASFTREPRSIWVATLLFTGAILWSAWRSRDVFWLAYLHQRADGDGYFGLHMDVPKPLAQGGGLVAILGEYPAAFTIPYFPKHTDFVRLQGSLYDLNPDFGELQKHGTPALRQRVFGDAMGHAICRRLNAQHGPLYVLRFTKPDHGADAQALAYYGISVQSADCTPIHSRSIYAALELCPATRSSNPECL